MKFYIVLTETGKILESEGYVQTLANLSRELHLSQTQIVLEPDSEEDGNQFDQAFLLGAQPGDLPLAKIYTAEQYANQK